MQQQPLANPSGRISGPDGQEILQNGRSFWIILFTVGVLVPSVYGKEDIHTAAIKGDLIAVKNCLENVPKLIEALNEKKSTPLILATSNGHLSVVAYLIERGAKVNAVNEYGRTSLHYAASIKVIALN